MATTITLTRSAHDGRPGERWTWAVDLEGTQITSTKEYGSVSAVANIADENLKTLKSYGAFTPKD